MYKKVYLIGGEKRSGKDTFAAIFEEEFVERGLQVECMAFAEPMKQIVSTMFDILPYQLEEFKNENVEIFYEHPEDKICHELPNFRQILQRFGSDAMKPVFGDTVWSVLLNDKVENSVCDVVIVTDFRFPSEYTNMDVKPYTIKINRDLPETGDTHISEKALKDFIFDIEIDNNGTIKDLRDLAKYIIDEKDLN